MSSFSILFSFPFSPFLPLSDFRSQCVHKLTPMSSFSIRFPLTLCSQVNTCSLSVFSILFLLTSNSYLFFFSFPLTLFTTLTMIRYLFFYPVRYLFFYPVRYLFFYPFSSFLSFFLPYLLLTPL